MSDLFQQYAAERLGAVAFEPDFEKEEEQIFAATLASFRQFAERWHGARNEQGQSLICKAGFVERMTPNAMAALYDDHHMIAMHQALPATITELSLYLFTQADFMPSIGDAAGEQSPVYGSDEAPGLYLLKKTLAGGKVDAQIDQLRVPRDSERHIAAVYFSIVMSRFVWLHEFAHCTEGHVLWFSAQDDSAHLTEVNEGAPLVSVAQNDWRKQQSMRHAMEYEADRLALDRALAIQIDNQENILGLLAFDLVTRLHMTVMAAQLMTWLFDEYQRFMASAHGVTHPSPQNRLARLMNAPSIAQTHAQIFKDATRQWQRLRGRLPGLDSDPPLSASTPMPRQEMPWTKWRFTQS